ncbi:MAG TPA: hypothetical protein VF406_20935 [Thermodesulfobacteriota bacterium]
MDPGLPFAGCRSANCGRQPYVNTCAWFMELKDGRIVKATSFYDGATFDDRWTRVRPTS